MTQRQIQQTTPPNLQTSQNYVYTVNRFHEQSEWMLVAARPRKWSKKDTNALLFASLQEAEQCISLFFLPVEQPDIFIGRLRVGN